MPVEILRLRVVHVPNVGGLIEINQGSQSASTYIMTPETKRWKRKLRPKITPNSWPQSIIILLGNDPWSPEETVIWSCISVVMVSHFLHLLLLLITQSGTLIQFGWFSFGILPTQDHYCCNAFSDMVRYRLWCFWEKGPSFLNPGIWRNVDACFAGHMLLSQGPIHGINLLQMPVQTSYS